MSDLPADFPTDEDVEVATEAIGEKLTLAALPGRGVLREAARAALQAVADARRTEENCELIHRCVVHGSDYDGEIGAGPPGCDFWLYAKEAHARYGAPEPSPCRIVSKLVDPQ